MLRLGRLSLHRSFCGWSLSLPHPAGTSPLRFLLLGKMSSLAKSTSLVSLSFSCPNLRMPLTPVRVEGLVGASLRGLRKMSFLPFPPWDKALGICVCCLLRKNFLCLFSFQTRCLFCRPRFPTGTAGLGLGIALHIQVVSCKRTQFRSLLVLLVFLLPFTFL